MFNYIDVLIVIFILGCAIAGFKRGFFTEVVSLLGFVVVLFLAFQLKDELANVFFTYLPFLKFGGEFQDITVLNIMLYEIIAFIVLFIIFGVVLKLLLIATNILEAVLKFTIVLGIPSKILGFFVGAVEGYLIAFLLLIFLNQPTFAMDAVKDSKLGYKVLENTPYISDETKSFVDSANELYSLKETYKEETNPDKFNKAALEILLKNKIVKVESVDILVKNGKVKIPNIEDVLGGYR